MKIHVLVILVIAQFKINYAFNNNFVSERFGIKQYILDLSSLDISANKSCGPKENKCIWKCCPEGQIIGRFKECISSGPIIPNVTLYDQFYKPTNKSLESVFKLVPGVMEDYKFSKNVLWWYTGHLNEDGNLYLEFPNLYYRWKKIETNHFCIDMKKNGTEVKPVFMAEYAIEHFRNPSAYKKWALIISILCLILTLVVYCVVPELRDTNGIILMIYFSVLILAFITHCSLESDNTMKLRLPRILTITFIHYFFKVSSFCWMNVMFYRLLITRRQTKEEPVPWAKQLLRYSGYAVGLPLFMTLAVATIELTDMSDMPTFITPQIQNRGNFSFHEIESIYYLYIPLMLILSFNWIVCFIKVVEFCKTSRQFGMVFVEQQKEDEEILNRPMQFVKLLAVMTLFSSLELLTVIYPISTRDTSAAYTVCIGPIILVIFVWSKYVRGLFVQHIKALKTKASSESFSLPALFQKK